MNYPVEIKDRVEKGRGCGSQIGKGWFDLVRKLDSDISKLCPTYVVDQVKEKFGSLRYYIGSIPNDVEAADYTKILALISEAGKVSNTICDVCGEAGHGVNLKGWYITRCDKHAKP